MLTMDVFNSDAFSATSLSLAVEKIGYVPDTLTGMPGLITPVPVRTKNIWIEERSNAPALIQTSPRGAPPNQKGGDKRKARSFNTVRLALASRIEADELLGIRAFGSETEVKQLMVEVARRQYKIKADMALTKENMLLNLVQGKAIDADGSVIYDWAAEFGQSVGSAIHFNMASADASDTGSIRSNCNAVVRYIRRKLQGLGGNNVRIVALCDDVFYDDLITSKEVKATYLNYAAAADLRDSVGRTWDGFQYGGVTFINYRGTDDNSTVAVPSGTAQFFPINAGIFQWAQAPAERMEFIDTPGQEFYSWIVRDKDRDMWADVEMYSYPLPVCVMPQALISGVVAA